MKPMKTPYCPTVSASVSAMLMLLVPITNSQPDDLSVKSVCLATTAAPTRAATLAAYSADGSFFAVATVGGRVKYGRTQDGAILRTAYQCHPRAVAISSDGRLLAVAGRSNGCPASVKIWNVTNGALLCRLRILAGDDYILSFSPDDRLLAIAHGGLGVDFWQLPQGTLRCSVPTSQPISKLAFATDGETVLAISADGSTECFSVP